MDLGSKIRDSAVLVLVSLDFIHQRCDFFFLILNLKNFLVILSLSLLECRLINLDFLIEKICFCASPDQLSAQDISFRHDELVLLLQFLLLILYLLDDSFELVLLHEEILDLLLFLSDVLLELLDLALLALDLLVLVAVLGVLLHQLVLFGVDLLLQLGDLVGHALVTVVVFVLLLLDLG